MKTISGIFLGLTLCFICTGLLFLLFPSGLVQAFNYLGNCISGSFLPLSPSSEFLWNVFSFAYMVLITTLGIYIALYPEHSRSFLFLMVMGKSSTSIASLILFLIDKPAFLYLITFLVDGAIAILCLLCMRYLSREAHHAV